MYPQLTFVRGLQVDTLQSAFLSLAEAVVTELGRLWFEQYRKCSELYHALAIRLWHDSVFADQRLSG